MYEKNGSGLFYIKKKHKDKLSVKQRQKENSLTHRQRETQKPRKRGGTRVRKRTFKMERRQYTPKLLYIKCKKKRCLFCHYRFFS